jgi:hypothetical protein
VGILTWVDASTDYEKKVPGLFLIVPVLNSGKGVRSIFPLGHVADLYGMSGKIDPTPFPFTASGHQQQSSIFVNLRH